MEHFKDQVNHLRQIIYRADVEQKRFLQKQMGFLSIDTGNESIVLGRCLLDV